MGNTQRERVSDSREAFEQRVVDACEQVTGAEIGDASMALALVCESSGDLVEIAREIECKLHLVIDDKCLEDVALDRAMTIAGFAELLRANIIPQC